MALSLTVFEADWTATTDPQSVVVTNCQVGDWLFVIIGSGHTGSASITSVTTSTTAGSTGSWTKPQENLNSPITEPWISSAYAQVTAAGSVTVQVDPAKTSSPMWGFAVIQARGSLGLGGSASTDDVGSTQTVSLTVQGNGSAVLWGSFDFSAGAVGSGWTPSANATLIERSSPGSNYTVHCAYWTGQNAGTTSYGSTGASGTQFKHVALEILAAPDNNRRFDVVSPRFARRLRLPVLTPFQLLGDTTTASPAATPDPWVQPPGFRPVFAWNAFQAQRARVSDPSLLDVAGFDPPLLGAYGDSSIYWQLYNSAANTRLRAPYEEDQRRRDASLDLLASALLENELLGSATTWEQYNRAATHVDRRLVPQQRLLESVPGLLDQAQLEVPPPLPIQVAAEYQRLPWLRVGPTRIDQSSVAIVETDPTQSGYGREWARWRRDPIPPQQRIPIESAPGMLDTALLENELLGGATIDLRTYLPVTHADRREYPQQTLFESSYGLLNQALLEIPPPLPWWYDEAAYLRIPWLRIKQVQADQSTQPGGTPFDPTQAGYGFRWLWRRDPYVPLQRSGIQNPDDVEIVGTGATGGWWSHDDSAHHFWHALPGASDPSLLTPPPGTPFDPTQAGYGPRWVWYRIPALPVQRDREAAYGLLDQALLEVVPPLGVSPTATHQRLPWLRIKQAQYDQSASAVVTDFDPTQGGGYGPEWHWWYRAPVAPVQREREPDPNLLLTALLENELLGGADDLIRHRSWIPRPWFGLQRTAVIDQSSPNIIFDTTLAGLGPEWRRWYRAPVAPVQRERESDPNLLNMALLEDPLVVGYGPRWMWYRTPVAPVQRDRESDPGLLLQALLEDALLGGWDDLQRHRMWYVDRREVPQQRIYPSALQPLADPLLVVGAEWRYRLIPVTHKARWVLRQWWQQQMSQAAPLVLFDGTITGGVRSGAGMTGGLASASHMDGSILTSYGDI